MLSPIAFSFALLTAISWASYAILARFLVVKIDYPLAFAVLVNLFASVGGLIVLITEGGNFIGITIIVLFATFISTLCSGVFEALQIFVRKNLEVSRSTVLQQLSPIITLVGSVILLHESFTPTKVIGTILIVGGNLIAAYRNDGALKRRWVFFAFGAAIALGSVYVADKFAASHYPLGFYMILSYFLPALYVFLFVMPHDEKMMQLGLEFRRNTWRLPILSFLGIFGYYLLLKTFRIAEASSVIPIVYTSTILTSIGGIVLLRERGNISQKLIGVVLVFAGVIILR